MKRALIACLAALLSLGLGLIGPALGLANQTWPVYQSTYINDFADIIDDASEARLRKELGNLRDDSGIQATILTLYSRKAYGTELSLESFATGLFNHWGIGDAEQNDGILIYVSPHDREMRIELGAGYSRGFDRVAGNIIDDFFIPAFKKQEYAKGIEDGSIAVISQIARPFRAGEAPPSAGLSDATLVLGVLAALGALFAGFIALRKYRPCPQCGHRGGLKTQRTTLKKATKTRKGEGERRTFCRHCDYLAVSTYTIATTSSASSSSGDSFGGGSSSGGGASGSW